jgi:hypothetical protein
MLSKLIQFFKNLHPIKNFARPINQSRNTNSVMSLSYEALTRELQAPTQSIKYESAQALTFSAPSSLTTFQNTSEFECDEQDRAEPVLLMDRMELPKETFLMPIHKIIAHEEPEITAPELLSFEIAPQLHEARITEATIIESSEIEISRSKDFQESCSSSNKKICKNYKKIFESRKNPSVAQEFYST